MVLKHQISTYITIVGVVTTSTFVVQITSCAKDQFPELTAYINKKINEEKIIGQTSCHGFPSLQICITQSGKTLYNKAFGKSLRYSQGDENLNGLGDELPHKQQVKATTNTLYDLASNTKTYATMMAIQNLLYTHKIHSLDDPIYEYLNEFTGKHWIANNGDTVNTEDITLKTILTHTAGFEPELSQLLPQYPQSRDKSKMIENILNLPGNILFNTAPNEVQNYSDIDFILAGFIIERIVDKSLDNFVEDTFYKPLGLKHTCYKPLSKNFKKKDCAATELVGNTREHNRQPQNTYPDMRTNTIQGEVHDEICYYCMQGISGHAGLFSTAHDISILQQLMLNNGTYKKHTFFNKQIVDQVTTPYSGIAQSSFGIGWKINDQKDNANIFGTQVPTTAYGHNGWTGTYTIIDPTNHLTIAILSNAIHTTLIDRDTAPNVFFGKYTYFLPEGSTRRVDWIGATLSDKIYNELFK